MQIFDCSICHRPFDSEVDEYFASEGKIFCSLESGSWPASRLVQGAVSSRRIQEFETRVEAPVIVTKITNLPMAGQRTRGGYHRQKVSQTVVDL